MKIEAEATITAISVNFPRAAELTSISAGHLRRMAANGTLRTVMIGRRRVIPVEALRELVQPSQPSAA